MSNVSSSAARGPYGQHGGPALPKGSLKSQGILGVRSRSMSPHKSPQNLPTGLHAVMVRNGGETKSKEEEEEEERRVVEAVGDTTCKRCGMRYWKEFNNNSACLVHEVHSHSSLRIPPLLFLTTESCSFFEIG